MKLIEETDSELERGELNFGRDDSDRDDIISESGKYEWENIDTKSILEEIRGDLE